MFDNLLYNLLGH